MSAETAVLYFGGTIGMRAGADGLSPAILSRDMLADVFGAAFPFGLDSFLPLIDSAEATPADWKRIALAVESVVARHSAVIVLHGTDTLSYTAAALDTLLASTPVPVVVTGSQLPLSAPGSDAPSNLKLAGRVAASGRAGVMVAFGGHVLAGHATKKLSSERFDAFDSPNLAPLAKWDGQSLVWRDNAATTPCSGVPSWTINALNFEAGSVVSLRVAPGMAVPELRDDVHAVIIELYGAGTGPSHNDRLMAMIRAARSRDVPVIATSQCPHGPVRIETYAAGSAFGTAGVVAASGLTFEAAYVRLHVLIANGFRGNTLQEGFIAALKIAQ